MIFLQYMYISLFFSQKKQPNLTRAVENIQINEEDNEIRYFVLLNVCISKLDLATSHTVHMLITSLRSVSLSWWQLPTDVFQVLSTFLISHCLFSPTSPFTWEIPSYSCLHDPSYGIISALFISINSRILLTFLVMELRRHVCLFSSFPHYSQDMLSSFFGNSHYLHAYLYYVLTELLPQNLSFPRPF